MSMNYISQSLFDNQYPIYSTSAGKVTLTRKYPANHIVLKYPNLSAITVVLDTSFRFILNIDNQYYTSEGYWADLQTSLTDNNPYFALESVKNYNIVKVDTAAGLDRFAKLRTAESASFIDLTRNVYATKTGIDYIELVKYIDTLVAPIDNSLIEIGGVTDWTKLCNYSITKPIVVNGDVVPLEITINNVTDNLLEGIVYWSQCSDTYPWPFEHLNKPTRYAWINGETISITNNTNQPMTVNVQRTGGTEITQVFKLNQTSITVKPNSTTQDISIILVNRFGIDKLWPKGLWLGALAIAGTGDIPNNYDYEYTGTVTFSSPNVTGSINIPLRLRKQSGPDWNATSARQL